jgi:hypothetical protein
MATTDAPRNDGQQSDPLDDTTFETTAATTTGDDTKQLEQTVQTDATEQLDTTEQLDRTERFDSTEPFDRTEPFDSTDATRAIGVEEPSTSRDLFGNPVQHADSPFTTVRTDEHVIAPLPERPTGPHAPAIVLGLVCLAIAGIILAQELGRLTVDWGDIGPVGIILTGAVLVLFGLVGLLSSRRNTKSG